MIAFVIGQALRMVSSLWMGVEGCIKPFDCRAGCVNNLQRGIYLVICLVEDSGLPTFRPYLCRKRCFAVVYRSDILDPEA